jgi:hypothetical protein
MCGARVARDGLIAQIVAIKWPGKIINADQRELVRWWDETVQNPGGDRQSEKHSPRSALMVSDAESLTGVKHQQVSRWRHYG